MMGTVISTCIQIGGTEGDYIVYDTSDLEDNNLTNMDLVMFIGCRTAQGGEGECNLPTVAVECGARTAIGFEEPIYSSEIDTWVTLFFDAISEGKTISQAIMEVNDAKDWSGYGLDTSVICGNKHNTLG